MEHTKKMVLIEPRKLDTFKESTVDKTLSSLDGETYYTEALQTTRKLNCNQTA